jgi:hypothetical protein
MQTDGLKVCMRDIIEVEQQRGLAYQWAIRLRPDIVCNMTLPPFAEWPRWPIETNASLVLSQASVFGEGFRLKGKIEVKDSWAVMTRRAAPAYLNEWPHGSKCNFHGRCVVNSSQEVQPQTPAQCPQLSSFTAFYSSCSWAEAAVGCSLYSNGVNVGNLEYAANHFIVRGFVNRTSSAAGWV